jgi:hypothetical protein
MIAHKMIASARSRATPTTRGQKSLRRRFRKSEKFPWVDEAVPVVADLLPAVPFGVAAGLEAAVNWAKVWAPRNCGLAAKTALKAVWASG